MPLFHSRKKLFLAMAALALAALGISGLLASAQSQSSPSADGTSQACPER